LTVACLNFEEHPSKHKDPFPV